MYVIYTTTTGGAERLKNTLPQLAERNDSTIQLPQLDEGGSRGRKAEAPPGVAGCFIGCATQSTS